MNRQTTFFTSVVLIALASCNLPINPERAPSTQQIAPRYPTVSALLTQTEQAVVKPSATLTTPLRETAVLATRVPVRPLPTLSYTPTTWLTISPTLEKVACDLAQAGRPIDVTIPDDTRLRPGEYFSKTWRLVNAGSCTWDTHYAVVWFSGTDVGTTHSQSFRTVVLPGKSVDITVEMAAPKTPGSYQSNWKLRNSQGALFGIGPGGGAPFWVRFVVIPDNTPTPAPATQIPTPAPSATPNVYLTGTLVLHANTGLDQDTGELADGLGVDVFLEWPEEGPASLQPRNGATLMVVGIDLPGADVCSAPLQESAVLLDELPTGSYVCIRTTQGLPGRLWLTQTDPEQRQVSLEYTTWMVP